MRRASLSVERLESRDCPAIALDPALFGPWDDQYLAPGETGSARWEFSGLEPGDYLVSILWTPDINRASNVPYQLDDLSVVVDQREATGYFDVFVDDGSLIIELIADGTADGYIVAEMVEIELVEEYVAQWEGIFEPEIQWDIVWPEIYERWYDEVDIEPLVFTEALVEELNAPPVDPDKIVAEIDGLIASMKRQRATYVQHVNTEQTRLDTLRAQGADSKEILFQAAALAETTQYMLMTSRFVTILTDLRETPRDQLADKVATMIVNGDTEVKRLEIRAKATMDNFNQRLDQRELGGIADHFVNAFSDQAKYQIFASNHSAFVRAMDAASR